ncbi:hypothetical protein C0995_006042 [Termitomyces sp. Mi166|nr:hypothetical protein C0995_006042 [Termitomyces sp. Mi166\
MQGQQARKELTAAQIQRAQDKESKRARGALSCAECRRLKLKCDKTVPCSSCKRRGCSAICPNGSLTTGQGTRFVLADTEKLHQKIAVMSDRIRQLEDALAILQSTQTRDPHPLLSRELLKIKSIIELHAAGETVDDASSYRNEEEDVEESQTIDAFGTLAIRDDGAATFYGRSAGQEGEVSATPSPSIATSETQTWTPNAALPSNAKVLASTFPFSTTPPTSPSSILFSPPHDIDFNTLTRTYLPTWEETQRLCALYLEQAPWFFGAVTRRQLEEEVLPTWYDEAPRPPESQQSLSPGTPHDLALLFILLTFGALTDSAALAAASVVADAYYTLTKAALALAPVLERPPSVATVQTLSLMAIYEGMHGGENSIEATWALMGMATKLAQSIGLHRDCARWNLPPAEVQKRRALFWELFITDCWQSLATGRLATFSLPFVDCELPFDPDQTMTNDGVIQPSFPFWKARFGAECVAGVVQGTLTSRAPRYSIILDLDRKVRDMKLPAYAQGPPPQGAGLAQTMSHFMPINYRELSKSSSVFVIVETRLLSDPYPAALLYIHRCFFAHAIASNSTDPIRSQYAPSFLAGYRSACTIIGSVRQQFTLFPAQISRFWVLWTHAFSAASKVAPAALIELRIACELFEQASAYGGRSSKFLPILQRLQNKARRIFIDTNSGIPPSVPGDIFRPTPTGGERKDELSIFSGKTYTLTTKAAPRTRHTTATTSSSPGSPPSTSDSPSAPSHAFMPVDNPSFANVHPSLVMELRGFDGHIAAQIREACETNGAGFISEMEVSQQEYLSQRQMEAAQRERAERDEMEKRQLERRQMEMEEQRFYEEQEEEERQLQLQEQEERYRQQQQAIHEQQVQRHLELDQQRQQLRRHQPHVHQQSQQAPSQHYQQHFYNDHHMDHTSAGLPIQHVTDHHSISSHSLNQMQPERPAQPQPLAQQHSMYTIPPEYRKALHQHPVPPQQPTTSSSSHYADHEQPYANYSLTRIHKPRASDHRPAEATQPLVSHQMEFEQQYTGHTQLQEHPQQQQQPQSAHQETYQYWTPRDAPYSSIDQVTQAHGVYGHLQQQNQHYTPDGVLRGIAADDTSLQETWQSYMYKVGSPRQFFED